MGTHRLDESTRLGAAGVRAWIHGVQLYGPAARGGASHGVRSPPAAGGTIPGLAVCGAERHLLESVHTLAPGSSRRAGIDGRRPEAAPSVAEDQRALVQAAVRIAGAFSDLLSSGAQGERHLSGRAPTPDRVRAADFDRHARVGARDHLGVRWFSWRAASLPGAGVLCLSSCVRVEPPRSALRYRSVGSRQMGHADARPLVLGLRVSEFELPPGTSLFSRRALLPAGGASESPRAVL